ncbi:MAG: cytochrome ubiquinol oxidase subunit I, partial [Brevundimonas sp.]
LTGVMVAMVPFDWQAHDSYFIVAHLHYVLIGGMVLPMFAAIYYWLPMTSSRPLSERLGKWAFWLIFSGVHLAFLPMHLSGLMGMPRRVYTYLPDRGWELPNMISTVGAFLFAAGVLVWIIDMCRNFRPFGQRDAGNIYDGPGLEWLPTGLYSVRSIPVVKSLYPLWDQPDLARDVPAGRYFLPNAATHERETIVTSPLNAEPQYLLRMPRPSGWHVWAAVFTAGFFLLLTIQAYAASVISGVLAVYCIMAWCWNLDRPQRAASADIGAGIRVPTYVSGPRSHGWWAMMITLIVAGMVCAMLAFAYVFLWSRRPDLWAPPPETGSLISILALGGLVLALCWAAPKALGLRRPRSAPIAALLLVAAAVAVIGQWSVDLTSWQATGLAAQASSQGAVVYGFIAWQAQFVATSGLMGLYILMRWLAGHLKDHRPSTVELIALFIAFTAGQGTLTALLVRLFPGV